MFWQPVMNAIRTGVVTILVMAAAGQARGFDASDARRFLAAHCVACHGPDEQQGGVRLDTIDFAGPVDGHRWAVVRDQIASGAMPPEDESRPPAAERAALVAWIDALAAAHSPRLPNHGNLVPHDVLFGRPAPPVRPPPPRLWRLSPDGYAGLLRDLRVDPQRVVTPFALVPDRGIRDYAALYTADEPTTEILVRNALDIVERQCAHEVVGGKPRGKNDGVGEFVRILEPGVVPSRADLEKALSKQFQMALARDPDEAETERFLGLYDRCAADGDTFGALKTMLAAVLLRSDAVFRSELGAETADGRRRLTQREIADAVSRSLTRRREHGITEAARKQELGDDAAVAAHVRRILDDPKIQKPALLDFFRDYFGYAVAPTVFKDAPKDLWFRPDQYVADTDALVLAILAEDRDVLRQLLTTDRSFVNVKWVTDKQTRQEKPARALVPNPHNEKGKLTVEGMYGLEEWPETQPAALPAGTRLGILMQPSWLVAWSTNFDNDVVRRGRFVRERLLGGVVPDLPIGVAAMVPDDRDRTLRDRLTVTRDAACWKCHRRMDELGLAFENFDHYGRFRTTEAVLDATATAANVDAQGKPLGPVHREARLDTSGVVAESGDPAIDGHFADPRELVRRLADSARVRQVFVRHAFRHFMGRNESLADAAILQAADGAYVASGGSFRALVTTLLSSDAFLYRDRTSGEMQHAD